MPDYNLHGLAPRAFEQLIQALASQVLGSGLVVFGDGPDGGREATFEGKVPYPSSLEMWDGYVVVQAKHRQRSGGTTADGLWAVEQLKLELKKYSKRKSLRRPEYYLFCTNVTLSPTERTGAKDKAFAILEKHKSTLGIKGFDIWDYDKIRVFLDQYQSIRRAYTAWITPGDVLATVIDSLGARNKSLENKVATFLQKELLSDQYVNLDQAGHAAEDRIPMASVFVDLSASQSKLAGLHRTKDLQGIIKTLMHAGNDILSSRLQENTDVRQGRFVLIGGPGQGKSTVSQYACQLYRVSLLRERKYLLGEVRQAIEQIERDGSVSGTDLPLARRFPVRIVLNDFAKYLADGSPKSVLSYLARRISNRIADTVTVQDLKEWLAAFPWFVVFDGLDEVPASSNRNDVLSAVSDFCIDANMAGADLLILATTRPQGYNSDFSPQFFTHYYLTPLSTDEAMRYAERLTASRFEHDLDRKARILQRLGAAAKVEATNRLMQSPLQVTIMAILVDRAGQPPPERYRLFAEYYDVIYKREMERTIPAASILRDHKSNIDNIHYRVGLVLQIESERTGSTDARLSAKAFGEIVRKRLSDEGYVGKQLEELADNISEAATLRLVFLVSAEANKIGFEIRSLQEFMASEALMDGSDDLVTTRLETIAPVPYWRNVFLFAAGKCFALKQHLRHTIASICANVNQRGGAQQLTLAGSELALDILRDGTTEQAPNFRSQLTHLATSLLRLYLYPQSVIEALGELYTVPATQAAFKDEVKRLLPLPESQKIAASAFLFLSSARGDQWAQTCLQVEWPSMSWELQRSLLYNFMNVGAPALRDLILDILFTQPLEDTYGLLQSGILGPEWEAIGNVIRGAEVVHAPILLEGKLRSGGFSLAPAQSNSRAAAFSKLPFDCGDLRVFYHAAQFWANPSAATLSSTVDAISELTTWESRKHQLPWPVSMALEEVVRTDKSKVLRGIKEGKFGTPDSWRAIESFWRQGITLSMIRAWDRTTHDPLTSFVVRAGSPVFEPEDDLSRLLAVWREMEDPAFKASLGRILAYAGALNTPEDLLCYLDSFDPQEWLPLGRYLMRASKSPNAWMDALEAIGRMPAGNHFYHRYQRETPNWENLMNAVALAYIKEPTRGGLIQFIYKLSGYEKAACLAAQQIPLALLRQRLAENSADVATAVLMLLHRDIEVDEVRSVARRLGILLANAAPAQAGESFAALSDPPSTCDQALIGAELLDAIPSEKWELRMSAMSLVRDSISRTTSTLHLADVQQTLGLPL